MINLTSTREHLEKDHSQTMLLSFLRPGDKPVQNHSCLDVFFFPSPHWGLMGDDDDDDDDDNDDDDDDDSMIIR